MNKIFGILFIILLTIAPCAAENGETLIEKAAEYDGKTVTFSGEVIGDIMLRRSHAWVNINDGTQAIGIWLKKDLAQKITFPGNYNQVGDKVEITGVFHRACPVHGGDLDIHAEGLVILKEGYAVEHPIDQNKVVLAGMLLLLTLGIYLFFLITSSRSNAS